MISLRDGAMAAIATNNTHVGNHCRGSGQWCSEYFLIFLSQIELFIDNKVNK